jgi:DNA-directed RNA polymerase specialized sigma24 family protein
MVEGDDKEMDLVRILSQFPEEYQSVCARYYLNRFSINEIATIKHISKTGVEELLQ